MHSKHLLFLFLGVIIFGIGYFLFSQEEHIKNYPPKDGPIVAFGDSLVAGVGAPEGQSFVSLLEIKIGKEIINLGVSGDTTIDGLARIEEVRALKPSIVILLLGGNDYLKKIPKEQTFTNLETIITTLQADGVLVVLLGVRGGLLSDGYDDAFEDLASEERVVFVPDVLDGVFGKAKLMADTIHPNKDGYAIIADKVYGEMSKVVP